MVSQMSCSLNPVETMKVFTMLLANNKFSVLKSTANILYLEEEACK